MVMGQLNNKVFEQRLNLEEADSGKLFMGLNLLGFFKNNEYFDTIVEGYTLMGYQLNPYLSYHLRKNVRLDAGVYLHQDFGNYEYSTVVPTLTLKIKTKPIDIIFGNLEGSISHRLIEPLYDFERLLTNRQETGIQFLTIKENVFFDLWIDWQNMIYPKDTEQERFVSGLSLNKRIINFPTVQFYIPVQLMVSHRGGQINVGSPSIETLTNSAVGLEVQHKSQGLISNLTLNAFQVFYKNLSTTNELPYNDGSGFYANGNIATTFGLEVMASYWQGHEFLSIEGGKIYPSVSVFDPTVQQENMQLMIFRFLYNREIARGIYANLRFEPYYDLGFKSFQYSYGLYFQIKDRFFLTQRSK